MEQVQVCSMYVEHFCAQKEQFLQHDKKLERHQLDARGVDWLWLMDVETFNNRT